MKKGKQDEELPWHGLPSQTTMMMINEDYLNNAATFLEGLLTNGLSPETIK